LATEDKEVIEKNDEEKIGNERGRGIPSLLMGFFSRAL